jgi:hypothetical protein
MGSNLQQGPFRPGTYWLSVRDMTSSPEALSKFMSAAGQNFPPHMRRQIAGNCRHRTTLASMTPLAEVENV